MWLRIRNERIRICPECRFPCLRINDYFDVEDDEESDPFIACRDCVEDIVSDLPQEYFQSIVEEDNRRGDSSCPELETVAGRAEVAQQFDIDEISEKIN